MAGKQIFPSTLRRTTEALSKQQCRTFSSTSSIQSSEMRRQVGQQMKAQRSLQSQMSRMSGSDIPSDFGLLPDTLLKPEAKDLPSWFSKDYRKRLRIAWKAFVQTPADLVRYETRLFAPVTAQV